MMRRRLWILACFSAKASDERVLPPPVGTVRENKPGGRPAFSRQEVRISARRRLTAVVGVPNLPREEVRVASISAMEGCLVGRYRTLSGAMKASVPIKSASTKAEKSMRMKNARL